MKTLPNFRAASRWMLSSCRVIHFYKKVSKFETGFQASFSRMPLKRTWIWDRFHFFVRQCPMKSTDNWRIWALTTKRSRTALDLKLFCYIYAFEIMRIVVQLGSYCTRAPDLLIELVKMSLSQTPYFLNVPVRYFWIIRYWISIVATFVCCSQSKVSSSSAFVSSSSCCAGESAMTRRPAVVPLHSSDAPAWRLTLLTTGRS